MSTKIVTWYPAGSVPTVPLKNFEERTVSNTMPKALKGSNSSDDEDVHIMFLLSAMAKSCMMDSLELNGVSRAITGLHGTPVGGWQPLCLRVQRQECLLVDCYLWMRLVRKGQQWRGCRRNWCRRVPWADSKVAYHPVSDPVIKTVKIYWPRVIVQYC
jgi:hypothetical protein